jgi:polyhydroxyalkanoate synthesis regulator protein
MQKLKDQGDTHSPTHIYTQIIQFYMTAEEAVLPNHLEDTVFTTVSEIVRE